MLAVNDPNAYFAGKRTQVGMLTWQVIIKIVHTK